MVKLRLIYSYNIVVLGKEYRLLNRLVCLIDRAWATTIELSFWILVLNVVDHPDILPGVIWNRYHLVVFELEKQVLRDAGL